MAKRTEYELQIAIGGKVDNSLGKSVNEINNKMDAVGNTMKAVAGIAATAFASIKIKDFVDESLDASKEFETSMAGVAKVVDGLKDDNGKVTKSFYEMKDSILDMSKDLPKTAEDIAAIMEAAGQSNIEKSELAQFTEDATKMGIAFDSTAEQAGEWMAAWRTALKLDQSGVVTLADQINYLGNTTSESANKISEVVTRVGSLAGTAGVTASSLAAIAASMTKVEADVSATGIKNFALALVSGESATKRQIKSFGALGLEAENVAKAMQTDSKGTILDVLERINKLDKDKQTSTMKNLFGSESISSIAPLVANLDNLKQQFDKVGDSAFYAGSMEQEYIAASSTAANVDLLKDNKIHAMQIQIGDTLVPLSTLASETTGNIAEMFGDFVENNVPLINNAVHNISNSFQELLPDAIYNLKSFADGGKDFFTGLKPVVEIISDNPGLIPNFLKATGAAIVTYKVGKNLGEIANNIKLAGSPLKMLTGLITNPWALAIGATAGGIAMVATSIASMKKELREEDLASRFGDITLSLGDLNSFAAEMLYTDNFGKISESLNIRSGLENLRISIDESVAVMNKLGWKIGIGLELTEEERSTYQFNVTNFISETQQFLDDNQYALNLSIDAFTDNDTTGNTIKESATSFYLENQAILADLGKQLQEAVNNAFSDGLLSIDEVETISNLQKQMSAITSQMAQTDFEATLEVISTKALGTDLTPESYKNLITELQEQKEVTRVDYDESLKMNISNAKLRLNAGKISHEAYDKEVAEYKKNYLEDIGELDLTVSNYATDTLFTGFEEEMKNALPQLNQILNDVIHGNKDEITGLIENGNLGQYGLASYMDNMLISQFKDIDISSEAKENLLQNYKDLLPTKEDLEKTIASYKEENKDVPSDLTQELNNILLVGALGGDESAIYTLIGSKMGEDQEYKDIIMKAEEMGLAVPETLINSLDSKMPDIKVKLTELKETVKEELEKKVYVDIPVDINLNSNIKLPSLFQNGLNNVNQNLFGELPGHKEGGIFNTPHMAWFAEDGPEAAIPLDGSPEAIRLWQMAGQILGMFKLDQEYSKSSFSIPESYNQLVNTAASTVGTTPSVKIEYNINVASSADTEKVKQAITMNQVQFNQMMDEWTKSQYRTKMGRK